MSSSTSSSSTSEDTFSQAVQLYDSGDYPSAFNLFKERADAGDGRASFRLSFMLDYGIGTKKNHQKALNRFEEGFKNKGEVEIDYDLLLKRPPLRTINSDNIIDCLRYKAQAGSIWAQFKLGRTFDVGNGVTTDSAEAMKWYKLAADQGNADAQYQVGFMYASGHRGVLQNCTEAMKWFKLAADQGHANSQYQVGHLYQMGEGVQQNYTEAMKWFSLAYQKGHNGSQQQLLTLIAQTGDRTYLGTLIESGFDCLGYALSQANWLMINTLIQDAREEKTTQGIQFEEEKRILSTALEALKIDKEGVGYEKGARIIREAVCKELGLRVQIGKVKEELEKLEDSIKVQEETLKKRVTESREFLEKFKEDEKVALEEIRKKLSEVIEHWEGIKKRGVIAESDTLLFETIPAMREELEREEKRLERIAEKLDKQRNELEEVISMTRERQMPAMEVLQSDLDEVKGLMNISKTFHTNKTAQAIIERNMELLETRVREIEKTREEIEHYREMVGKEKEFVDEEERRVKEQREEVKEKVEGVEKQRRETLVIILQDIQEACSMLRQIYLERVEMEADDVVRCEMMLKKAKRTRTFQRVAQYEVELAEHEAQLTVERQGLQEIEHLEALYRDGAVSDSSSSSSSSSSSIQSASNKDEGEEVWKRVSQKERELASKATERIQQSKEKNAKGIDGIVCFHQILGTKLLVLLQVKSSESTDAGSRAGSDRFIPALDVLKDLRAALGESEWNVILFYISQQTIPKSFSKCRSLPKDGGVFLIGPSDIGTFSLPGMKHRFEMVSSSSTSSTSSSSASATLLSSSSSSSSSSSTSTSTSSLSEQKTNKTKTTKPHPKRQRTNKGQK